MAREQNFGVNVPMPYDPDELNTNPIAKLIRGVGAAYAGQKAGTQVSRHELKREQELMRREQAVESAANQGRLRGEGRGDVGVPVQAKTAAPMSGEKIASGKGVPVEQGVIETAAARKAINETYKSPREALMAMPDNLFKSFVDESRMPGLGYAERDGRIERILPPLSKERLPEMNTEQLQAYSDFVRAKTGVAEAKTGQDRLGIEGRRADLEGERIGIEKQKLERELKSTDTKNPLNVMKALLQYSPKTKRGIFEDVDGMMEKVGEEEIPDIAQGIKIAKALGVEIDDSVVQTLGGGTQPKAKPALPKVGDVVKGYKFKGGNPADPKSWEKT